MLLELASQPLDQAERQLLRELQEQWESHESLPPVDLRELQQLARVYGVQGT